MHTNTNETHTLHADRQSVILMATGDTGSVSWQPAIDLNTTDEAHADVVCGGFISGNRQLAGIATDLLRRLEPLTVRFPGGDTYNFPRDGRAKVIPLIAELDENGEPVPLPSPEGESDLYEVIPSKEDIVAALYLAASYGSTTVTLNDNALDIINSALGYDGDTVHDDNGDDESEVVVRTRY